MTLQDNPPAPSWHKMALELRAPFELGAFLATLPLLLRSARGDGHAVLVFPGMLASDLSTEPLRLLLRRLGYEAQGWDLGRNTGLRPELMASSLERIHKLHHDSGRKLSLIGQSLGGIYARELAKQAPDAVRGVITLGTPFTGGPQSSNAWRLFEMLNGTAHHAPVARAGVRQAPPVPTTSIYSKSDGIVAWQCCVQDCVQDSAQAPGTLTENIEVECSHQGMGVNPLVLHAVVDRLAQAEGQWRPFERSGLRQFAYR